MHFLFGPHADIQNKQYHNVSTPLKNKDRLTHAPLHALGHVNIVTIGTYLVLVRQRRRSACERPSPESRSVLYNEEINK